MPDLDFEPLNREPPVPELVSSFITKKHGYDRNHGAIPDIDGEKHLVHVDGAVETTMELSILQLRDDFQQHTVVCALQCAGNRRHTMRTQIKEVEGIDWFDGAVMKWRWRGPRVRDILNKAKVVLPEKEQGHVAFASYAVPVQEDDWYGGSISLERAMDLGADVILALDVGFECPSNARQLLMLVLMQMNDKPLTAKHGYPVRVVTPGIAGARAVKWLDKITVQNAESSNYYQQHDYKILPQEATDKEKAGQFWDTTPALQDMPVNSVIADPQPGSTVSRSADGTITVQGYALPSGRGGPVVRVEVSTDCKHWIDAELVSHVEDSKWSWKLWKAAVKIEAGQGKMVYSRATDKSGATQEKHSQWNLRGVGYNGYGDTEITVE